MFWQFIMCFFTFDLSLFPQKSLKHFWDLVWVIFPVFSLFDGATFLGTVSVLFCMDLWDGSVVFEAFDVFSPCCSSELLSCEIFPQLIVDSMFASSRSFKIGCKVYLNLVLGFCPVQFSSFTFLLWFPVCSLIDSGSNDDNFFGLLNNILGCCLKGGILLSFSFHLSCWDG